MRRLRIAGIDAATPDVPGGIIERDADGVPTGILHENAVDLVARCYPKPDLAETTAAVQAATPGMWATGIVALHNANDSGDGLAFRTYQELRRRGELGLRVLQQFPVCNLDHLRCHRPAQRSGRRLAAGRRGQDVRRWRAGQPHRQHVAAVCR